jgi:hypothetical protein
MNDDSQKMENALIQRLLGDEFAQQAIYELGLDGMSPDAQAEFLEVIGTNILLNVTIEIIKLLPHEARPQFESYIESGDVNGLRQFLLPYIPDLDAFIQHEAAKEYEATKTRAHEIAQGL